MAVPQLTAGHYEAHQQPPEPSASEHSPFIVASERTLIGQMRVLGTDGPDLGP